MTGPIKTICTYTAVKDVIFQIVQKSYGYEVASSLRDIEEYYMEGERPTIIMILDMDPNTRKTNQISLDMLYQADIAKYIKRSKEFKKNLRKSYTVIWELFNKQLQTFY